jgi:hypothetical protein
MKTLLPRLMCVLSVATCLVALAESGKAQHTDNAVMTDADRVEQMFKNAGLTYTRKADIFVSDQNSRRFIFALNKNVLVGFSVMATKGSFQSSAAALQSFLQASYKFDYVKMVIDEDGDLSVRFDYSIRVRDQKEFENIVHQLMNAEGDIRKDIQPYLISAKP